MSSEKEEVYQPLVSEETIEVPIRVEDYRFKLALAMTYGYLALLVLALIGTVFGSTGLFEKVAAAISGPMGAIWGYYFGVKKAEA